MEERIIARWVVRVFSLYLLFPCAGFCNTVINIGLISFDVSIPGDMNTPGANVFNILNFTGDPSSGGFALPPDFPVMDSLTFLNSSLTLMSGGPPLVIPLGDLGPGSLSPTDPVQFPDTTSFSGAIFTATLNQTSFLLADGSTFVAGSSTIAAEILPLSGPFLVAGSDFAVIAVSEAPEPSTMFLVGGVLVILIGMRRKKHVRG